MNSSELQRSPMSSGSPEGNASNCEQQHARPATRNETAERTREQRPARTQVQRSPTEAMSFGFKKQRSAVNSDQQRASKPASRGAGRTAFSVQRHAQPTNITEIRAQRSTAGTVESEQRTSIREDLSPRSTAMIPSRRPNSERQPESNDGKRR